MLTRFLLWLFEPPEQKRKREMNNVYLFMARQNRKRRREDEACLTDECVARVREAGQ